MYKRSYIIDNGGVDWRLWWFECNHCKMEIHESWPHYAERENNLHYCQDCALINEKITEKEYLQSSSFGWMTNAHAVVRDGKVFSWVGKYAPFDMKVNDFRRTSAYRVWRNKVLERDGNKCRHCSAETKLQAHHIKPFATFEKLRFKVSNGLTLCEKCHKAEHKRLKQGDPIVRRISI